MTRPVNLRDCAVCLDLTASDQYLTSCCGAPVCQDCFIIIQRLLEPADLNLPTCDYCHQTVQALDTVAALSQLTQRTNALVSTKLANNLEQTRQQLDYARRNLTALLDNITSLKAELSNNSLGVTATSLDQAEIKQLNDQLQAYATGQAKAQQLVLDQLLAQEQLLLVRLNHLQRVISLTVTQEWLQSLTKTKTITTTIEKYSPVVWWRRTSNCESNDPWQLLKVWHWDQPEPSWADPTDKIVVFQPRIHFLSCHPRHFQFLTRLLDGRVGVAQILVEDAQGIIIAMAALQQNHRGDWILPQSDTREPVIDFTITLPGLHSQQLSGYRLGLLAQGYYFFYSVQSPGGITMILHHCYLATATANNFTTWETFTMPLPDRPTQLHHYGQAVVMIINRQLMVIDLIGCGSGSTKSATIILTLAHKEANIIRTDRDRIWLNLANREVWSYNVTDLISAGRTQASPQPLSKLVYQGPTDYTYSEIILPGGLIYFNTAQSIIRTADRIISRKIFTSLALASDGSLVALGQA